MSDTTPAQHIPVPGRIMSGEMAEQARGAAPHPRSRRAPHPGGRRAHRRPQSALRPPHEILPLQMLAYEVTIARGQDPDAPRALAKITETR